MAPIAAACGVGGAAAAAAAALSSACASSSSCSSSSSDVPACAEIDLSVYRTLGGMAAISAACVCPDAAYFGLPAGKRADAFFGRDSTGRVAQWMKGFNADYARMFETNGSLGAQQQFPRGRAAAAAVCEAAAARASPRDVLAALACTGAALTAGALAAGAVAAGGLVAGAWGASSASSGASPLGSQG